MSTFIQPNRQCQFCLGSSENLLTCSRCKRAHYCDPKCQRSDWKVHKLVCNHNAATAARIKDDSQAAKANGVAASNIRQLAADLKKWSQSQRPLLTWAAMNGLQLHKNPSNATTHCLQLKLERNSSKDPSKGFTVTDIDVFLTEDVIAISKEKGLGDGAQQVLNQARSMVEKMPPGAMVPIVVILCGGFLHLIPVGLDGIPDGFTDNPAWESGFKSAVLGKI